MSVLVRVRSFMAEDAHPSESVSCEEEAGLQAVEGFLQAVRIYEVEVPDDEFEVSCPESSSDGDWTQSEDGSDRGSEQSDQEEFCEAEVY